MVGVSQVSTDGLNLVSIWRTCRALHIPHFRPLEAVIGDAPRTFTSTIVKKIKCSSAVPLLEYPNAA